jgi:dipeptidase E
MIKLMDIILEIKKLKDVKLLLTSGGLSNKSISNALRELVGKDIKNTSVAFIPTASNVEDGDKQYLIDDLDGLNKRNYKSVDVVDISALKKDIWKPRLENADILFFEGGNSFHLMRWINKSGFIDLLPGLLKTKIYVGVSAGSMVACPDLALELSKIVYNDEESKEEKNMKGIGMVDFYILPHLNSKSFPNVKFDTIEKASKTTKRKIYALDDQMAIKVVGDKINLVGNGKYYIFN